MVAMAKNAKGLAVIALDDSVGSHHGGRVIVRYIGGMVGFRQAKKDGYGLGREAFWPGDKFWIRAPVVQP